MNEKIHLQCENVVTSLVHHTEVNSLKAKVVEWTTHAETVQKALNDLKAELMQHEEANGPIGYLEGVAEGTTLPELRALILEELEEELADVPCWKFM